MLATPSANSIIGETVELSLQVAMVEDTSQVVGGPGASIYNCDSTCSGCTGPQLTDCSACPAAFSKQHVDGRCFAECRGDIFLASSNVCKDCFADSSTAVASELNNYVSQCTSSVIASEAHFESFMDYLVSYSEMNLNPSDAGAFDSFTN